MESNRITLLKLDLSMKKIDEESINRPKSYESLNQYVIQKYKINSFEMYYYDSNNEKAYIKDNDEFKKSTALIFINEKKSLEKSIYLRITPILDSAETDEIEEKYLCNLCNEKLIEKPYYCYRCSKRICGKCLNELNERMNPLKCSFCKYELPKEKWLTSSNFSEERKQYLKLIEENKKLKYENLIHNKKENEFLKEIKIRDEQINKFKNALSKQVKNNRELKIKNEEEINQLKKEKDDLLNQLKKPNEKEGKRNPLTPNENIDYFIYNVEENHFDKDNCVAILGENFAKNNRDKGTLIINDNIKIDHLENKYKLQVGINKIKINLKEDITDFSEMFYCCYSLIDISPLKKWNVSNAKSFECMFYACISLNDISPLKDWNVSNGENFNHMFCDCESLNDISPLKNWNVSNGNDFNYMFCGCVSLSDISPLKDWNVSNGKDFECMFYDCSSLRDVSSIKNWNVSKEKVNDEILGIKNINKN